MKFKKIKFHKKNKKTKSYKNSKKIFAILVLLLLYIILSQSSKDDINYSNKILNEDDELAIHSNDKMYYKGELVLKSKFINDYLSRVSNRHNFDRNEERHYFYKYFYLPEYTDDPKIQSLIRKKFYEKIYKIKKKNISKIDTLLITKNNPFGNNIPCINNAIFYCEILGCNQVILQRHHEGRRWLITKPVYIEKLNITIKQGPSMDCHADNIICPYRYWDLLYPFIVKPEIRINYIKNEILSNLPSVTIDPNALYMHIRGGDIFTYFPVKTYSQPPFCFYERIIDTNKFSNIYIIAQDKRNVVYYALIKKYPNIIFEQHNFEHDLSILTHAYYLALSVSSFSISAIKFNDNLKKIWEYDMYRLSEMYKHLHHYLYKFDIKFQIFSMKPSDTYASKMFSWGKKAFQKGLMVDDNCTYDFTETKPNR